MQRDWYIVGAGGTTGPFSIDELRGKADRGEIGPHTQLQSSSAGAATPAQAVAGIFQPPPHYPPTTAGPPPAEGGSIFTSPITITGCLTVLAVLACCGGAGIYHLVSHSRQIAAHNRLVKEYNNWSSTADTVKSGDFSKFKEATVRFDIELQAFDLSATSEDYQREFRTFQAAFVPVKERIAALPDRVNSLATIVWAFSNLPESERQAAKAEMEALSASMRRLRKLAER